MTTDDRIAARRAELQQRLDALPADEQLPATATREDLLRLQRARGDAERDLASFDAAVAAWRSLGGAEDDERWLSNLAGWRQALCAELLTIKSPIRDKAVMGRSINLTLSIRCIDFGLHKAVDDSGYDLSTLRLGQLMREAGYEARGSDLATNYVGVMPWRGSMKDVERRIADLAGQRQRAEAALESALLSDEERAAQEAEAKARRDAANALPTRKVRGDGSQYDKYPDGRRVEVAS